MCVWCVCACEFEFPQSLQVLLDDHMPPTQVGGVKAFKQEVIVGVTSGSDRCSQAAFMSESGNRNSQLTASQGELVCQFVPAQCLFQ